MNIAIIGPSPVPFSVGGMEFLQQGLYNQINELTNHSCELIKLPCRENTFWDLIDSYKNFYDLNLDHFDAIISIKYPAWMVRHKNHICYMAHRLRGFYDTYHFLNMPENVNSSSSLVLDILKYIDDNKHPDNLDYFFELTNELRLHRNSIDPENFSFPSPFIRKLVRYMDDFALSNTSIKRHTAISNTVKNRKDYFPKNAKVEVIYPPSFLKDFSCGAYEYIFTVSRLDSPKRIDLLVEAFKHVKADVKLKIAGKGPEEDKLKRLAGNDARIEFLGYKSNSEVLDLYSNALAVAFLPYDEDLGLVTIEAMMSKKPVLTCNDSGGTNEFVKDRLNGFVVKPNPNEIAQKIDILANNKELAVQMGEEAYNTVKNISWESVVKSLLDINTININRTMRVTKQRKKITVTSHFAVYPPRGGGQSRIFNLYKNLAKEFDVEIISMCNNDDKFSEQYISKNLKEIKIPKTIVQAEKEWEYEKEVGIPVSDSALLVVSELTPQYGEALKKSIADADYIVLSHPYLLNEIEKYRCGKPLIYEAHNVEYNLKKKVYKNNNRKTKELLDLVYQAEKEACEKSNFIMTCSDEDKITLNELYNISHEKFLTIPNGVDCEDIEFVDIHKRRESKSKLGIAEEHLAVFIGSWHPPNIEACEHIIKIAESLPLIKFLIIGSACGAIKDYRLPGNVGLMGVISDEEKRTIYSIADIALNPMCSGSGTNLKMFDYMAAGIPIVTTEFGTRGIGDKEYFNIADIKNMGKMIEHIFMNYDSYNEIVKRARLYVEENFDWDCIANIVSDKINL